MNFVLTTQLKIYGLSIAAIILATACAAKAQPKQCKVLNSAKVAVELKIFDQKGTKVLKKMMLPPKGEAFYECEGNAIALAGGMPWFMPRNVTFVETLK